MTDLQGLDRDAVLPRHDSHDSGTSDALRAMQWVDNRDLPTPPAEVVSQPTHGIVTCALEKLNVKDLEPEAEQEELSSDRAPSLPSKEEVTPISAVERSSANSQHRERSGSGGWTTLFGLRSVTSSPIIPPDSPKLESDTLPHHSSINKATTNSKTDTPPASFSLASITSALKRPLVSSDNQTSSIKSIVPRNLVHKVSGTLSRSRSVQEHVLEREPSSPTKSHHLLMTEDQDAPPSVPNSQADDDQLGSEESLPFDFNRFLEQMRHRGSEPIGKYLRSFLKEFQKRTLWTVGDQIRVINDFLDFISIKMRELKEGPWYPTVCSEAEFENSIEAMEKLVMNRLWHLTFTPALPRHSTTSTDDLERDSVLSEKIKLFSWVTEEHLDIRLSETSEKGGDSIPKGGGGDGFIEFAKEELLKINAYKAPRDKMICLLNACKVIFGLIRHLNSSEGADTFIPVLILVTLRANPEHLISNMQYIQRFRNPDRLQGESGYYLSSLSAAISFIEKMDHSALSNISQAEFETNVEAAILLLPKSAAPSPVHHQTQFVPKTPVQMATPLAGPSRPRTPMTPTPGNAADFESPADLNPNVSFPDATKAWFQRVPDLAERAVSKPLNALARIVDDLAGDGDESARHHAVNVTPHQRRRASSGTLSSTSPPQRRRGTRPWSVVMPSDYQTPTQSQHGQYLAPPPPPNQPRHFSDSHLRRSSTSPLQQGAPRPLFDGSIVSHPEEIDDAEEIQREFDRAEKVQRAQHEANISTLKSIFPALEGEVLEVVLVSSSGDMSQAIDALLEMSS